MIYTTREIYPQFQLWYLKRLLKALSLIFK